MPAVSLAGTPQAQVEIYDVAKRKVIHSKPISFITQKEAAKYIKGIDDIYVKVNPIPKAGQMIKIPLEPPIAVKNEWMDSLVDEVIVIFPKGEKPYLMMFDDENQYHFLQFKGSADDLLKYLGIHPTQ